MEDKDKIIRRWLALMICTVALLLAERLAKPVGMLLSKPEVASFLVYMQTGRVVKLPEAPTQVTEPSITAPIQTEPVQTAQPEDVAYCFSPEDAELVQVSSLCAYTVDLEAMLLSELDWQLAADAPTVLILHSHATESYTKTESESYVSSAAYRTLDTGHNMIRVGAELKALLEENGIRVIHDTTLHDHPSYTDAYVNSRETALRYLEEYPTIRLVLDLHRDAAELQGGGQLETAAAVDGKPSAQLMLVVGSDAGGRIHPGWRENMALAVKLHARLETRYPGLCRPISLRTERFNQDLSSGALLVEVGAAGDTLEESLTAVRALAEGIADLAGGTVTAGSTS